MTSSQSGRRRQRRARTRTVGLATLVVFLCIGLGAAGAAIFTSVQPHLYAATSVVRVYDPTVAAQTNSNARIDPTRQTAIEVSFAESDVVTHDAKKALKAEALHYDHVTWTDLTDQDAISVTCYAGKAAATVSCAHQFAAVYIATRKADVPQTLGPTLTATGSLISQQKRQLAELQLEISKTNAVTQAAKLKGLVTQEQSVGDQINTLAQQLSDLRAQIAGLTATYQVVQPAVLPDGKVSPTPSRNFVVGLLGGLLVGVAILLMWQQVASTRRAGRVETGDVEPQATARSDESMNGHHADAPSAEVDETARLAP